MYFNLVIKNLSPEELKKYIEASLAFVSDLKRRKGESLVFFRDSVDKLKIQWALSNIYRNFG